MGKHEMDLRNLARWARRQTEDLFTQATEAAVRRRWQGTGEAQCHQQAGEFRVSQPVVEVLEAVEEFCHGELWEWRCRARERGRTGTDFEYSGHLRVNRRTGARPEGLAVTLAENWSRARGRRTPWGDQVSVLHELSFRVRVTVPDPARLECRVEVVSEERIDPRNSALLLGGLQVDSLLPEFAVGARLQARLEGLPGVRPPRPKGPGTGLAGICRGAFAEVFPRPYAASGRYRPTVARPLLSEEALTRAHYAPTLGALYADPDEWKRAWQFVAAFTRKRTAGPWRLERAFGPFAQRVGGVVVPRSPADVLARTCHLLLAQGARERSRDEVHHTATLEWVESGPATDLPEPYGKWLQRQGRPPWGKGKVELELVIHCQVRPEQHRNSDGSLHPVTVLDLELSALALPVLVELGAGLAPLLTRHCPAVTGPRLLKEVRHVP